MNRQILVLFAHPALEASQINKNIVSWLEELPYVTVHDLYEKYPDFQIDVQTEQTALLTRDVIVWLHPFYWYSAPPLLKHWIDTVLEYNWAYGPRGGFLAKKLAFNVLSAGGGREAYKATGSNHYTIREFLRPFEQTARLCKMTYLAPYTIMGASTQDSDSMENHRRGIENIFARINEDSLDMTKAEKSEYLNDLATQNSGKV